ncbi:MAG: leucine-rich repeat protein, partial [Christensenellaceae bacterium]|nr:leucine-rich repeat protein [Christensenellaceae bacterium]
MKNSSVNIVSQKISNGKRSRRYKVLAVFLIILLLTLFACKTDNPIVSIEVVEGTFNQSYAIGDPFSGAKLRITYKDETKQEIDITADMLSGFDTLTSGVKTVTITYLEKTTQIDITVGTPISEIAIKDGTFDTEYFIGDPFTTATLIVSFEDGSSSELQITLNMLSGFDTATAGEKNITVSYNGKSTSILINVKSPFVFAPLDDNTYELISVDGDNPSYVVPQYYNGRLISKIKEGVFNDNHNLESLTLPFVGGSADATGDEGSFYYIFPEDMPLKLKSVTITGGSRIEDAAFEDLNTKYIELPQSIEYIGSAFEGFFGILKINALTPPEIDEFMGLAYDIACTAIIIVPETSVAEYKRQWVEESPDELALSFKDSIYSENELVYTSDGFVISNSRELLKYTGLATNITLSHDVLTINPFAFSISSDLRNLTITSNLETIKNVAIFNCPISQLVLPSTLTTLEEVSLYSALRILTFNGSVPTSFLDTNIEVYLPESLSLILVPPNFLSAYKNALVEWESIIFSLDDPNIETIQNSFIVNKATSTLISYIGSSTNVVIPAGITTIGKYVFSDFANLVSVEIPEGVTTIDEYAFSYTYNLTSVSFPSTLTTIGGRAFYESGLQSVSIPSNVEYIGERAFYNYNESTLIVYLNCSSVPEIDREIVRTSSYGTFASIIIVPDALFEAYKSHSSWGTYSEILFSDTQMEIIDDKFIVNPTQGILLGYLGSDSHIVIPDGITEINDEVFLYSNNLISVTLPASLESIRARAFYGCSNLMIVTLNSLSVPTLGNNAFSTAISYVYIIAVADSLVSEYKSEWSQYASRIYSTQDVLVDSAFI